MQTPDKKSKFKHQFRFKSIASRIIWSVVPIVLITTLVSVTMIYFTMNGQIDDQFNERMKESVAAAELSINNELSMNEDVARSLAAYASACRLEQVEADNTRVFTSKEEELIGFVRLMIASNPNTAGGGIWYANGALNAGSKSDYYVHMVGGAAEYIPEYGDFYLEDWYTTGIVSGGETVWSDIYNDLNTGLTMITSTVPIFGADGAAVGVATADMALTNIREIISQVSVGETGRAFLLGKNGGFVSFLDDSRTFEQIITEDADAELAALGRTVFAAKTGMTSVEWNGYKRRAYFMQMSEIDWRLVLMINEAEVGRSANSLIILLAVVPIVGLVLAVFLIFVTASYLKRVAGKVNSFAGQAASGTLTGRIEVTECDEFGRMEQTLNRMMDNMAEMTEKSEHSRLIAQEANMAKTQFLSKMSHEMRTPMNAVIGMTQIAAATSDRDKVNDCLGKIMYASRSLLELINNILDMAKIEANKVELELKPFALKEVCRNIVSVYSVKADEKNIALSVKFDETAPGYILSDELRYSQILTNIIGNALKFTPEGGVVTAEVRAEEEDGRLRVITSVRDTGIGVSPEAAGKLFNAFEQADSGTSRKYGGTGLGLSISKNLAGLLGGGMSYSPNAGGGSCFTFDIIAEKADPPALGAPAAQDVSFDFSGKCILVAEDIEINREIVAAFVEDTGVSIDFAENGKLAVEMFAAHPTRYDLIFMDIQMPEMDGLTAAAAIRALPCGGSVPIYAMSANAFKGDVDASIAAGMDGHLAKPLNVTEVLTTMAAAFSKK